MTKNPTLLNLQVFDAIQPTPTPLRTQAQIGNWIEETAEGLNAITTKDPLTQALIDNAFAALEDLRKQLKSRQDRGLLIDNTPFLDALCDVKVAADGVGHVLGYDMLGASIEVAESNLSKLLNDGTAIFSPEGKWLKGPNYKPPVLFPFLIK